MNEKRRLRALDAIEAPDLWEEVEGGTPLTDFGQLQGSASTRQRVTAALVAFVVAGGALFALVQTFDEQVSPSRDPDPSTVQAPIQALDPISGSVAATIDVGPFPSVIAAGEGAVWVGVPSQEPNDDSDTVARIDPVLDRVDWEVEIRGSVYDLAAGHGAVWASVFEGFSSNRRSIVKIDPRSRRVVDTIDGVGGSLGVDEQHLWATTSEGDGTYLVGIDPETGQVAARIRLPLPVAEMTVAAGAIWMTTVSEEDWGLVRVDAESGVVQDVALPVEGVTYPPVLAADTLWMTVCCSGNHTVAIPIDPATGSLLGDPVPTQEGFAVAAAFDRILLMTERGGLLALNPATLDVEALTRFEWPATKTAAVESTTGSLWIANYRDTVTRVDISVRT